MIRALSIILLLTGCATDAAETKPPPDADRIWCLASQEMARTLHRDFGETPVYAGLTVTGLILEIFTAPEGRTFTLVITHPILNQACVVYAGVGWRARIAGAAI